ncbi:hypothetical protein AURDEDRAFT_166258 [Auricularia subglabra TFB-10046 SS5]|nr:hypothetical protein AURDEDRAFT_166258 [Auricularia subglabra TFB-10046 SS5]
MNEASNEERAAPTNVHSRFEKRPTVAPFERCEAPERLRADDTPDLESEAVDGFAARTSSSPPRSSSPTTPISRAADIAEIQKEPRAEEASPAETAYQSMCVHHT